MLLQGMLGVSRRKLTFLATTAITPPSGGTPVGNQLKPSNIAQAYTMYTTTAVAGDVIDMDGAWFTPGAPYSWVFTRSNIADPGITINCHPSQVMKFFGANVTNARTRVVGANLGADLVTGVATADTNHHIQLNFCSMFSFFGCFCTGTAYFALYLRNCADITARYNNFTDWRHDGIRVDEGMTRYDIRNNNVADNCPQQRVSYKADSTAPWFTSQIPGAPWLTFEPDHADGTQGYTGAAVDVRFEGNLLRANIGQGIWWSDVASFLRAQVVGNTVYAAYPHAVSIPNGTDIEFTGNTVSKHPDFDPDSGNIDIYIGIAGGAFRTGSNTFNAGVTTVTAPGNAAALSGAISGSTVTAAPPTWSTDGATVGTIPSKISGQPFVSYSGIKKAVNPPILVMDGTSAPWAAGSRIKALPGNVKTPFASFIGFWNGTWTKFFKDGALQQTAQGPAGMVSPVTTAGSWTAQQSMDSTDGINGTWGPLSAAATISAPAGITLNPSDKNANITLSNGNLTATLGSVTSGHYLARAQAGVPIANGDWYYEVRPKNTGIAMCSNNWSLTADPTDFSTGRAFGMNAGSPSVMYWNGGSTGLSPMNTSGYEYDGTKWFGILVRRTQTTTAGDTVKVFIRGPGGWSAGGGNPYAGGGGHDWSGTFGGSSIVMYPAAWMNDTGDAVDFNFGGSAYAYTLGGSPSNIT